MRIWHLVLVCNVWLWAIVGAATTHARETYAGFATRIVAEAQSKHLVRPDLELQLFGLANRFRQAHGLRALALDKTEQLAARAHAMDMMLHHFTGHMASTGHDFEERVRALNGGLLPFSIIAENAARVNKAGPSDAARAQELFQLWVKSPAHKHALLGRDFVRVATGVVSRDGLLYADQIFIGPTTTMNLQNSAPVEHSGLY